MNKKEQTNNKKGEFATIDTDNKMEKGNYVNLEIDIKPDYNLFDIVWFYLSNSLELKRGMIIGLFYTTKEQNEDNEIKYYYQVKYYREMANGEMKMFIGNVTYDKMSTHHEKMEKHFEKEKEKRIKEAIRQGEIDRKGVKAEKDLQNQKIAEIDKEIERLKKLRKK